MLEEPSSVLQGRIHRLGHAIVEVRSERGALVAAQGFAVAGDDAIRYSALDARHCGETAIVSDVRSLGRPGRHRAGTRNDQHQVAAVVVSRAARPVGEYALEGPALRRVELARQAREMPEIAADAGDAGPGEVRQQLGDAKRRQGIAPAKRKKLGHRSGGGRKGKLYAPPLAFPRPRAAMAAAGGTQRAPLARGLRLRRRGRGDRPPYSESRDAENEGEPHHVPERKSVCGRMVKRVADR